MCQTNPSCHRGPGSLSAARINWGGSDSCQIQRQQGEYTGAEEVQSQLPASAHWHVPGTAQCIQGTRSSTHNSPWDKLLLWFSSFKGCPMEDGTLGSQGCLTDLSCMLSHLHSPQVDYTSFSSPKIYFKLSSPHLSTQLQTDVAAARQRWGNAVPSREWAHHGHTLLSPANLTTSTPSYPSSPWSWFCSRFIVEHKVGPRQAGTGFRGINLDG